MWTIKYVAVGIGAAILTIWFATSLLGGSLMLLIVAVIGGICAAFYGMGRAAAMTAAYTEPTRTWASGLREPLRGFLEDAAGAFRHFRTLREVRRKKAEQAAEAAFRAAVREEVRRASEKEEKGGAHDKA